MTMHTWTLILCALWLVGGVLWPAEGAHRKTHTSPFGNPRHNEVFTPPSGVMVEALRQLLKVPSYDVLEGHNAGHRMPRPPRYMLNLYRRISQGDSSLPRHANTVRSFKPRTGEADQDMLLYNISALVREQVLGAWLHLRGSSGKEHLSPRLRPTRILVYLLPEGFSSLSSSSEEDSYISPAPIMTHTLSPHQQEIELTRGVQEVVEKVVNGRDADRYLGIKVEELRRGKYIPRAIEKLARRPPLLFVYSSDPTLLDLQALGTAALNLTKGMGKERYAQSAHLKRYTRESGADVAGESVDMVRAKRSIGDSEWVDEEIEEDDIEEEEDEEDRVDSSHNEHHPLLTNELPFGNHLEESPFLPKVFPPEESDAPARRHRRRRKKHNRKRKGEDDNLIPFPENYSKTKWGESENRRRNKRRRRNRKLPDEWVATAQNTLSNDANSLNFRAGLPAGGPQSTRPCDRHKLQVNFKTLGWDHWIIAPEFFDAFYCAGVCPIPLTKQMSGSNHAIIQSMIYSMGLRPEVPAPCCVPEKLDSLTMLSLESNDYFVLKHYSKMIAKSCSCQ